MAIVLNDNLSKYLGEYEGNTRFDNWLFHYLASDVRSSLSFIVGGVSNLRDEMAKELLRLNIYPHQVLTDRSIFLVTESDFDWFENTRRFSNWFLDRFGSGGNLVLQNVLGLKPKQLCILKTDIEPIAIQDKLNALELLKSDWDFRRFVGDIFKWVLKGNEVNNVDLAYQATMYLKGADYNKRVETYEDLLIYIDYANVTIPEAKSSSAAARRKISQKKYRDESKTKKQINALIEINTYKNLEKLSQKHGLSKAKVIEMLINIESERKIYISEKKAAWERGDVF